MHVQPHYHYLVLTLCKLVKYSSGVIELLQVCLSNNKSLSGITHPVQNVRASYSPGSRECLSEIEVV